MDNRFALPAFALLRFFAGVMFLMHGTQKIFGWPGDREPATAALSITAGWIEMITGALMAVGLAGSWAAFLASGLMAFAYWMRHGPKAFLPIENKGELAVLYCFLFLWIAAHGSGAWSIDSLLRRRSVKQ